MNHYRTAILSLTALALTTTGFAGNDYPSTTIKKNLYAVKDVRGKKAPTLHVPTWLAGGAPSVKGKVVLIDFWATWCPPCRELIPELNSWKKKFGSELVIIGVTDEDAATVKAFMKKTPMLYHVGTDPKHQTSDQIGVQGIPHVLVISADGIVRWQGFPLSDEDKLTDAKLGQIIKASKAAR